MGLTQKTDGHLSGGDIEFLMYDSSNGIVSVTVSQEALEDYADPRGLSGSDTLSIFNSALADIIEAADKVYDRAGTNQRRLLVSTRDLNG
ncbi:hypothetical protein NMG46_27605 [Mesorhizobium sp. LMG 17147]|uniref:hypothetical protein n=1 Tax=Mesorhizobium sp. LMG 17147 TaxID=2963091 RepID=UPI0020CA12F7|nr:hypothetical protein [Mesorhizobium sp. LMG 17147]MCP9233932.1 hypothetical protein [Mesorhizobium sp. LMG 17147]